MATENSTVSRRFLPAPFDDVQFKWDVSDQYVTLTYQGQPERLIECGAIEPHMANKAMKGETKPRVDSNGQRFHRNLKVLRNPLRNALEVTRYIHDLEFLAALPGAPAKPRFKRLDWLDRNPGALHVSTAKYETFAIKRTAGTPAALIDAGFAEFGLSAKKLSRPKNTGYRVRGIFGRVHVLMRGYLEIEQYESLQDMAKREEIKSEPSRPRPRPRLRLVSSNESGVRT